MVSSNPFKIIKVQINAARATAILTTAILLITVEKDPVLFLEIRRDMKYGRLKDDYF